MSTTNSGFIRATISGAVQLVAAPGQEIGRVAAALAGTRIDQLLVDLAKQGYALNGTVRLALSGTTPQSIDLTSLTTGAQSYAGDVTFAKFGQLIAYNDGAAAVAVAPAASNGASVPFSGITLQPGDDHIFKIANPVTVDGTHKMITVTPTAGGSFILLVGGQ
jgi:hypothetical protein